MTSQNESVSKWIRENINKRVCTKFVGKKKKGQPDQDAICKCGYKKTSHISEVNQNDNSDDTAWDVKVDTKAVPTDAFGAIEVKGSRPRFVKYVRVDKDTDQRVLQKLLFDCWKLERPKAIISVAGGGRNFKLNPRIQKGFNLGLLKAAESAGAWIITGGQHAGIMKHVGAAVNKTSTVCLGIASWGCVNNKETLVDTNGSWQANYRKTEGDTFDKEIILDCNHSHLILVDDGRLHWIGKENTVRAALEASIKEQYGVPGVVVVIEGGLAALNNVSYAVESDTPAVILEGSGRAADVLAYAHSMSTDDEMYD